jgi:hypothetical protein
VSFKLSYMAVEHSEPSCDFFLPFISSGDPDTPDVTKASENKKGEFSTPKHENAEEKTEDSSRHQKEGDDFEDMLSGLTSLSLEGLGGGQGTKKPGKKEESQKDDLPKALQTTSGKSKLDEREERRKNVLIDDEEALKEGEWYSGQAMLPCLRSASKT